MSISWRPSCPSPTTVIVISFGKKIAEGTPEEVANNKLVQEAYFGVEDDEILAGEVETHA